MPDSASPAAASFDDIPATLLEGELARIARSRAFRNSPRHQRFLRHLVQQAAAGAAAGLKESVLAREVFGRQHSAFDPAHDTIVRVEARRLRQRLDRYYDAEGRDAALVIHLPVGSYVPLLRWRDTAPDPALSTRRARDLVERGEHFLRQPLSRNTLEDARERFAAALAEDPRCVPALVGLARAWYNLAAGWHRPPALAGPQAVDALRRALELDGENAVAHAMLGTTLHHLEFDWPAARRAFERALELAPRQAFVHHAYGCALLNREQFAQAEHELTLARSLDPHYPNARTHMINLRIAQGRLDDAQAELDAMLDIAPDSLSALGVGGVLAMLRGDAARAIACYEKARDAVPDHPNVYASLASAYGFAGRLAEADATLAMATARLGSECLSPYVLAVVAARCGRADAAFAHLGRAIADHDTCALMIPTDPSFVSLRGDPRWRDLVRRLRPRAGQVARMAAD